MASSVNACCINCGTMLGDGKYCPECGTRRSEFEPGMVIRDKYEVIDKIGEGAMAEVYKVRHVHLDELRAMKVPAPHLLGDAEYLRRFTDEARKTLSLPAHRFIVRSFDLEVTENGVPLLLMEYVAGRSLRDWIDAQPQLGWWRWFHSAEVAAQVAEGLAAAHGAGILHCDIKPHNLVAAMPASPLPVKILDFGIAKATEVLVERAKDRTVWGAQVIAGTPSYMSPEQALGRGGVNRATDIYSLGIVLFEMLTGTTPNGDSEATVIPLYEQVAEATQGLMHRQDIPTEMRELVARMLARDSGLRPSAAEVANQLMHMLPAAAVPVQPTFQSAPTPHVVARPSPPRTAASSAGAPSGTMPPALTPSPAEDRSPSRITLLIAAVTLLVIGVVVYFNSGSSSKVTPKAETVSPSDPVPERQPEARAPNAVPAAPTLAQSSRPGTLTVSCDVECAWFVDGERQGTIAARADAPAHTLAPGRYDIKAVAIADPEATRSRRVEIVSSGRESMSFDLGSTIRADTAIEIANGRRYLDQQNPDPIAAIRAYQRALRMSPGNDDAERGLTRAKAECLSDECKSIK